MTKTDLKRQFILEKLADHLLAQGMQGSSLRPLAAAAGLSDRMLLHYFVNKEEVLTAALKLVAARMISLLESNRSQQLPFQALLPSLVDLLKDPNIRPFLRLWLELAALSAAEEAAYRQIARQISDSFYDWLASALKVNNEEERAPLTALAFATIEGFVVLDALDYGSRIPSALKGITLL